MAAATLPCENIRFVLPRGAVAQRLCHYCGGAGDCLLVRGAGVSCGGLQKFCSVQVLNADFTRAKAGSTNGRALSVEAYSDEAVIFGSDIESRRRNVTVRNLHVRRSVNAIDA